MVAIAQEDFFHVWADKPSLVSAPADGAGGCWGGAAGGLGRCSRRCGCRGPMLAGAAGRATYCKGTA